MADTQILSRISFRAPTQKLSDHGLVAWADIQHGLLVVQGVEVRRTLDQRVVISFPPARVLGGRLSASARPVSDPARTVIQAEIIAAAMREGWL